MSEKKKRTILVTGGAGFIGSHLCKRLVSDPGNRVVSLDNYFTGSKENHVPGVTYIEGHTKDIERHVQEMPDIIFHLGEYARVEQSILEPDLVHDLNVVGTRSVLNFWKKAKCKFVYAGSSTKFGDGGSTRHTSPYASSKASNSELVKEYGEKFNLPYAVTYFYNVYGPGERAGIYGTLIEAFKSMYIKGDPLTVVAPGTQKRNFTHVDDIVDGLILVGEKGHGDEYGLGNEHSFTILDVVGFFGCPAVILPPRRGNRMESSIDTSKTRYLGWKPKRDLPEYIRGFVKTHPKGLAKEKRVIVFSTTFYPTSGPAEHALLELINKMPDVIFDIVTTVFSRDAKSAPSPAKNATVHRVGFGHPADKFLLPILGYFKGRSLCKKHTYIFVWSIMASYAAMAGIFLKKSANLPILITLADQNIKNLSVAAKMILKTILANADQVYGIEKKENGESVMSMSEHKNFIGSGDAFANQLRYAYEEIVRTRRG